MVQINTEILNHRMNGTGFTALSNPIISFEAS